MRRALHVINSLDPKHGGTSVSVPALAKATAATNRYESTILQARGDFANGQAGHNTTVTSTDFSALKLLSNLAVGGDIDDLVRQADVIQIHGMWQRHCVSIGALARRHAKPVVFSAHGMLETWAVRNKSWKKQPYSLLIERPNLRYATVLRALTEAEAGDYRRYGLTSPIVIIPNGVDSVPPVSPDVFLTKWPHLRGRRLVLYLSRIHHKKGVDMLAIAWSRIAPQFPDTHLVIAGPDSEGTQAHVERLVRDVSMGNRVTFTGPVFGELKSSLFNAASLFVLPSHSEGFSMATLEALAVGIPVIITEGCHFEEITAVQAGWLTSPVVEEIVSSLNNALSAPVEELRLRGQRGKELVQTKYTWAHIGRQMADTFDWILGGPEPTTVEIRRA